MFSIRTGIAEYWLKIIENFGGNSPVLVVINKIDENPAFELNRKFLQEKYPSIRGFYRLSCKSNERVEEFSNILQEQLTKVKHLEIKWPKSWFNVKNNLKKCVLIALLILRLKMNVNTTISSNIMSIK